MRRLYEKDLILRTRQRRGLQHRKTQALVLSFDAYRPAPADDRGSNIRCVEASLANSAHDGSHERI